MITNTLKRQQEDVITAFQILETCLKSSRPVVFCKKGVLRSFTKFTGKHLCRSLYFNKVEGQACNFIKIGTLTQVFSCEFWEISKNTFSYRKLPGYVI